MHAAAGTPKTSRMSWTTEAVSVRILDKHEAVMRDVLSARFPSVRFVDNAAEASGLKVLMSFRPPTDEPLEAYDWVHSVGAGVDHLCEALSGSGPAPVITRTTGHMGQQIGEYCLGYALAHFQKMAVRRALQAVAEARRLDPRHRLQAGAQRLLHPGRQRRIRARRRRRDKPRVAGPAVGAVGRVRAGPLHLTSWSLATVVAHAVVGKVARVRAERRSVRRQRRQSRRKQIPM